MEDQGALGKSSSIAPISPSHQEFYGGLFDNGSAMEIE
jgi:hypothetical protein